MSGNKSWRRHCRSHDEIATSLVRKCVAALKRSGVSTDSALHKLACELNSSHRRMRSLFYGDGTPIIADLEWNAMRRRAALFFLNLERRHLELAEQCRAQHSAMVVDQMDFCWEGEACGEEKYGPKGPTESGQR